MGKKTEFRAAWSVVFAIFLSVGFSQPRQAPRPPDREGDRALFLKKAAYYQESPNVTKLVLKNGMTVLVYEYRVHPVISVQAYVHVGSFHDPSKSPGMTQLLAAMAQRGRADGVTGTLRQQVHTMGGQFRRATGYLNTMLEIVAASSQWKNALKLQAHALFNPSMEEAVLKREAGLLIDECGGLLDDPHKFASEALLELAYGDNRLGILKSTSQSPLGEVTPKQLADFHERMFTPPAITLVITGDVRSGEILNEVARVFGDMSAGARPWTPAGLNGAQREFRYRAVKGHTPLPILVFGFRAVPETDKDYRAMEVLSAVLGLGKGSVLFSRMVDRKKIVYGVETTLISFADSGCLTVRMETNPQNIDRSEIAALTLIEVFKREGPAKADMERAVAQLERSYWDRMQTVTGRGKTLARFEALGDWKRMNRYLSELRNVSVSDVKRVANRYLRLENCSLLEYLPHSMENRSLKTEMIYRTLDGLLEASVEQEEAERSKEILPSIKLPNPNEEFSFDEIRYPLQLASILRGPDMLVREDHSSPLVHMGIFFPGGKQEENPENCGITELMLHLMPRAGKDRSASRFYRQLEIYGGKLRPLVADDYFGFYFTILSKNFEEGFGLLLEAIKDPEFSTDSVKWQKEIQHAEIARRKKSVLYAKRLVKKSLFKNFHYAYENKGNAASLDGITQESLQVWYDLYVKNRKPIVVAIGDAKGTSLASYFVRHFSGSRMRDIKISDEYAKPLERGGLSEREWGKRQSLVLIGFQAPPLADADEYTARIIQGYFGEAGKLSQNLRDNKGAGREIFVDYEPNVRGGSMMVGVVISPGNENGIVESVLGEVARAVNNPIPGREFRSALNSAVGVHRINAQERFSQIEDLVKNEIAGYGIERYEKRESGLQEVTEEDFKDVARRIFNREKAVILKVRGQAD